MRTFHDAKLMAKILRQAFVGRKIEISHSEILEIIASQFGFANWNVLAAKIDATKNETGNMAGNGTMLQPAIPVFRIFSIEKTMEFYQGFLGFTVDWKHRFDDNFPLYCQISRDDLTLHLSEHAGDASPGARAFVYMTGVAAFHAELTSKDYRYMKPGINDQPWGKELKFPIPSATESRSASRNKLKHCGAPGAFFSTSDP